MYFNMTMLKRIFLLLVSLLFCSELVWAQRTAQDDDRTARRQWEEDQRADEYANSLRRRDWLKDRLILEMGMGTKFPIMGANWFGFGAGAEYITRWHASAFVTFGFIPSHQDPAFPEEYELEGGTGWRIGLAYYLFPKSPIHLGFQVSYGTVFYDHQSEPSPDGNIRSIIVCRGYEFDVVISYLSDQWYFLQAMIGVYTIGNGLQDIDSRDNEVKNAGTWGRTNDSWKWNDDTRKYESKVEVSSAKPDEAIPPVGIVFGIGIGFAFEEFFPDDTELRRRDREDKRTKQNQSNQFRTSPAKSSKPGAKNNRIIGDDDE
jgi:hypothetical protein